MRWLEAAARLALIAGLAAAITLGSTVWVTAPLGLLAIAAMAELAVRPYAASPADRFLLGCGAVVTVLILAGLALNLTPWGLTRATWTGTWLLVSVGVLVWRRDLHTHIRWPGAWMKSSGIWAILASVILVFAVVVALAGVRRWDQRPALAFSVVSQTSSAVVVEIDATSTTGEYEILARSDTYPGRYASASVDLDAGGGGLRLRERLPVSTSGAWTIDLRSVARKVTVRLVKVNVTSPHSHPEDFLSPGQPTKPSREQQQVSPRN